MKLMLNLLLNLLLCIFPLTFITKVLRLVVINKWFKCLIIWLVWYQLRHLCLTYMMCCVTKATPFQFISGNILKSWTSHTQLMSHHITPLVINPLGADTQTHISTHTNAQAKMISRNQACVAAVVHAWFNNVNRVAHR